MGSGGLTKKDIREAFERREAFFKRDRKDNPEDEAPKVKSVDDGKSLTIQMDPVPDSPIPALRKGEKIRFKFLYHAIEIDTVDEFGGKIICEYHILDALHKVYAATAKYFPKYSKEEIKELARQNGLSQKEARRRLADFVVEKLEKMKIEAGRFLHNEFPKALDLIVRDLLFDANFIALQHLSYQLTDSKNIEKTFKPYLSLRRKRVAGVKAKGRPKGRLKFDEADFHKTVESIQGHIRDLESSKSRVTKHAVARKLYPLNSNPLQQINRFLKRYDVTFEKIQEDLHKPGEL